MGSYVVSMFSFMILIRESLREKYTNTGKYGPEKTPHSDIFHAGNMWAIAIIFSASMENDWRYKIPYFT